MRRFWVLALLMLSILASLQAEADESEKCDDSTPDSSQYLDSTAAGLIVYKSMHGNGGEHEAERLLNLYHNRYNSYYDRKEGSATWVDIVRSVGLTPGACAYDCLYQTAVDRFEIIKKDVGANSPYLKRWVSNQMQVFQTPFMSPLILDVAATDPPRAVFDRQYQEASFLFYKQDFEGAQRLYENIFKNQKHPYRGLAGYMIARTLLMREKRSEAYHWLVSLQKDTHLAAYQDMYTEYRFITNYYSCAEEDKEQCTLANAEHLSFLRDNIFRLNITRADDRLYRDSIEQLDYYLQKRPAIGDTGWFSPYDKNSPRLQAYVDAAQKDPFFDWMQTYYTFNPLEVDWSRSLYMTDEARTIQDAALNHAVQRWQAGDGDEWLYAAALRMYPGHAAFVEVRDAAQKLFDAHKCSARSSDRIISRALWTHLIFMKLADGLPDSLVQELVAMYKSNRYYSQYKTHDLVTTVVRFLLHQQRYDDIATLAKAFVQAGSRHGVLDTIYGSFLDTPEEAFKAFPREKGITTPGLQIINRLSTHDLLEMIEQNTLPKNMQTYAARIAFVRSVLLEDSTLFEKAAYAVIKTHPALKNEIAALLERGKKNPQAAEVTSFLLKHPRFNVYATENNRSEMDEENPYPPPSLAFDRIDTYHHNDNNWWCRLDPELVQKDFEEATFWSIYDPYQRLEEPDHDLLQYQRDPSAAAAFFSYAHSDEWTATGELRALSSKPNGTEYLTQQSLAAADSWKNSWKRWLSKTGVSFEEDQSIPAMLHMSVVTSRYGCNRDGSHAAYSKSAFKTLHRSYPHSVWTKLTPYWFE